LAGRGDFGLASFARSSAVDKIGGRHGYTVGLAQVDFGLLEGAFVGVNALLSPSPVIQISPIPQNPSGATVYGASSATNSPDAATNTPQLQVTVTVPGQAPVNCVIPNYPVTDLGEIDVTDLGEIPDLPNDPFNP
jgi:hypothetical protein